MSETGGSGSRSDDEIQPLLLYNSVHHREQNAIDCANSAEAEIAAQIYNACILMYSGIAKIQIHNNHPLNFASIVNSGGSLPGILSSEANILSNIARANMEAQQTLLQNFENLVGHHIANAATAELVAALGELDAAIRQQSDITPLQRG